MNNKKGQQMTLSTIIAIVLGLVVLVFLIYGFSTGWGNLWERVTGLGGGNVNVDTVSVSCTLACQQKNEYGFCNQTRSIVVAQGGDKISGNCTSFSTEGYVDGCSNLCKV